MLNVIDDVNITKVNTTSQSVVYVSNSHFTMVNKLIMSHLDSTASMFIDSTIDAINMSIISNSPSGLQFTNSHIDLIVLSNFTSLGSQDTSIGSAILMQDTSSTIDNCNFTSNVAKDGAAIAITCAQYES